MKEQILKLREEGKTYKEIHKLLGCSTSTISYYCAEGSKAIVIQKNRDRRQKNREWLDSIRKTFACKCGEKRWWVLDFHHRNPLEKDKSVSDMMRTASRERVIKEIAKCEILCANCHRDLHYQGPKE